MWPVESGRRCSFFRQARNRHEARHSHRRTAVGVTPTHTVQYLIPSLRKRVTWGKAYEKGQGYRRWSQGRRTRNNGTRHFQP